MNSKLVIVGVLTLTIVMAFLLSYQQNVVTAQGMTQDEAVRRAISIARRNGLVGEPKDVTARIMKYADFQALLDDVKAFPEEMGQTTVWLVVLRGVVRIEEQPPGPTGETPPLEFDNIYIVLNSVTGQVMELGARTRGHEIILPASKAPAEGSSQPENFPAPSPKDQEAPTATPLSSH